MRKLHTQILICATIVGLTCCSGKGDDWPQFRGPNRDGKSAETGLLRKWPQEGPKLLWATDGLGIGFSSIAIADGLVYTTGMVDREGFLFAYDVEGNFKWKISYGQEWTRSYPGTRSAPTVSDGRICVFSGTGVLTCFDAKTAARIWSVDTLRQFGAKNIRWGMSDSPLIDGPRLYCTPGGLKGAVVALDKRTGETIWATAGLEESSAYSSLILFERGGKRLLATMLQKSVICVSADDGALIWRVPYPAPSDTGTITPIYHDGCLYVTSVVNRGITTAGTMFEISEDGTSVKRKWNDQTLDCQHGGVVLVDGYLYGSNWYDNTRGDWICLDWDTGKVMYVAKWNGNKGSIIYADKMLYCYDEETGDVALVKTSPKAFEVVSTFGVTRGSGKHWAHPAISDGRLYIRHGDALMAYDIKNR
ncbi:MAG: PQQ-like beta-propeller repeat protein [Phycisphaerales bacterium]|nr:MAG: PQQ-like beta-propeller repeat protein [Phycisphaerales bacterium]